MNCRTGTSLALSGFGRFAKGWPASYVEPESIRADRWVVGDEVVEFTPAGEIVWRWNSFDHLDRNRIGYDAFDVYWEVRGFPGHADWTHGNGVCQDPRDDGVIVSLRLQDAVLKIDRSSGSIRWILGDHRDWSPDLASKLLRPVGASFRWPWHGHNPRLTSDGTIVMFDNGLYQARPGMPPAPLHTSFSRGVEYRVDEEAMVVEQVWASANTDDEVMERTVAMGDAHRFEDSDTALVIHSVTMPKGRDDIGWEEADRSVRHVSEFPSGARILEYDRKDIGNIVLDVSIQDPDDLIQWEVFNGFRKRSLYPENSGVTMIDGTRSVRHPLSRAFCE